MSDPRTITYTGQLVVRTCWCGIAHAIPEDLARWAEQNQKNAVFCPLGHEWVVRETDSTRLRRQLEQQRDSVTYLRSRVDRAEAAAKHQASRAAGFKGQLTKTKKRVGRGVCPCCNRHFVDVQRHMENKHPDYVEGGGDGDT